MAQSLSRVILHVIFSTKNRKQTITEHVESRLHAYIAGICTDQGSHAFRIGGTSDHLHIVCLLPRTLTIANLLQEIKQSSSVWIKNKEPLCRLFEWQSGYAVFSIGESQLTGLIRYIDNQKQHHKKRSFKEELLDLLEKYAVDYDERYLWD